MHTILKDLGKDGFQFKGINFEVVAGNGFEKFVKLGIFLLLFVVVFFFALKLDRGNVLKLFHDSVQKPSRIITGEDKWWNEKKKVITQRKSARENYD